MFTPLRDSAGLPNAYREAVSEAPASSPLEGNSQADVVIIGAGFTGLSAALHLAEAGRRPTVLEAREIGWGASGRNFGQVVPYTKHSEDHVLGSFGIADGTRLIDAVAQGPDLVFGLIDRHGIDCAATRNGLLFAAHSEQGLNGLRRRAGFWQQRQQPVEMLDRPATVALTGSDLYHSALIDRRGGTINPLAYAYGLASAAVSKGATLHTGAQVTGINAAGNRWRISTAEASVTTETVIIATDAYTGSFAPEIRNSIIPMRAYQLVSKPLGENTRKTILPQGQSLTDTRRLFSGVRLHGSGRLHVSVDGPAFSDRRPFLAKINQRVARLFPQLGAVDWEEEWSGWVGMTADQYPRLVKLAPGCFSAFGYSGRGVALATMLGRELARHIAGTPGDELILPLTMPKPIAIRPLSAPLVSCLMTSYRILDAIDDRRLTSQQRT